MKKFLCTLFVLFCSSSAFAQNAGTVANHAFAIGKGAGITGYTSLLCGSGQLAIGSAVDPTCQTVTGDGTLSAAGVLAVTKTGGVVFGPLATVTPGAGVATWIATPSGANLATALTTALPTTKGGTGDTGSAWGTYVPAPSCGTATFTVTSAKFKTMGKTTWAELDITIATLGTCSALNTVAFTLPNVPNSSGALAGREITVNGRGLSCSFVAGSATGNCVHSDAAVLVVNEHFVASGAYENQ